MRKSLLCAALVLSMLLLAACGGRRVSNRRMPAKPVKIGQTETGTASWYGIPYHGRRAANGEVYDMDKLTAAHRTMPFDTWVEVTNLENRKMTTVRITDRGPFVGNRIIDLSKAAAIETGMIGPGTAKVRLKVVRAPQRPVMTTDLFGVQVGSFSQRENAARLVQRFEREFGAARMVERNSSPPVWRVVVGSVGTESEANELASRLQAEFPGAFVVRIDAQVRQAL